MILQVTWGCVLIGNIDFKDDGKGTCDVVREGKSEEAIQNVCKLWCLPDADKLAESCSNKDFGGKIGVVKRSVSVSKKLRDSMGETMDDTNPHPNPNPNTR